MNQLNFLYKKTILIVILSFFISLSSMTVIAQTNQSTFPNKQVRLVVPFPAGGGSDNQARNIADQLSRLWNQTVVVENITGAGGNIAASSVVKSKADGYTIFFATHPILVVNPFIYKNLTYDTKTDLIPVIKMLETHLVLLVSSSSPYKSLSDVIKVAKENPELINFGSGGIGTTQHLSGELLNQKAHIKMTHIPFRGNAQTTVALLGNQITLYFDSIPSAMALIKSGKVRGLAVTSRERLPNFPELPTVAETLPGFESILAYGLLVPKGTPSYIVDYLNQTFNKILKDTDYRLKATNEGAVIVGGSALKFSEFLSAERIKWAEVIKNLNINNN